MKRAWMCRNVRCGRIVAPTSDGDSFSPWRCFHCGTLRWSWSLLLFLGAIPILLVTGVLISPGDEPEAKFISAVKRALVGTGQAEGVITRVEEKRLVRLSEELRLDDRFDLLVRNAREQYLMKRKVELLRQSSSTVGRAVENLDGVCELAERMDIGEMLPECANKVQSVHSLLNRGEFDQALLAMRRIPDSREKEALYLELKNPMHVDVRFQYQLGANPPSKPLPLNTQEIQNITLTYKDNYRFLISLAQDRVYVYVFQMDHYGQMFRLIPDPVWSEVVNPLRSGLLYRIPLGENDWLYLDHIPAFAPTTVKETFYVVASPWRSEDLEQLYGKINEAVEKGRRQERIEEFKERLHRRNNPEIKALYYIEFEVNHGG